MNVETVLITGASSGIGRELARCFAAEGCRLILVSRKSQALQALADELHKAHKTQSEILPADLSEPRTPTRIVEHLQVNGTKVDVLINNAGFGAHGGFAALPVDRQLEMVQVNLTALTHLTRLLLPFDSRGGVLQITASRRRCLLHKLYRMADKGRPVEAVNLNWTFSNTSFGVLSNFQG